MGAAVVAVASTPVADRRNLLRRAAVVASGLALAAVAVWATSAVVGRSMLSAGGAYDRIAAWLMLAGAWIFVVCGPPLWWWRPTSRSGPLVMALGATWAAWVALVASGGSVGAWSSTLAVLFRPLAFWLLLAWPTGRLGRGDARWLTVYAAAQALCFAVVPLLFGPNLGSTSVENPLLIADLPRLVDACTAFGTSVLLPVGAVVLAVALTRRYRRLPPSARPLARPALVAGLLFAAGDLVLVVSDYLESVLYDRNALTLAGAVVVVADYLRFATLPVILVVSAGKGRREAAHADRVRRVEIGTAGSERSLQASVVAALGDPTAQVAYRRDDQSWVGPDGLAVALGGAGREVTVLERLGAPVAAVECDAALGDRPTIVEAAVVAAGSTIDHERVEALARARREDALRARRAIVEAEDAARRQLERDLHDGAQQRLVGLALAVNLARQDGHLLDEDELAAGLADILEDARRELDDLAGGLLPLVLARRGLGAALTTLAATVPLAVDVDVSFPDELPPTLTTTTWFVVTEAVANAVKHAGARRILIRGDVRDAHLEVSVADDGRGGADAAAGSGLRGLRTRIEEAGGRLMVDSPPGHGTVVRAEVPLAGATT